MLPRESATFNAVMVVIKLGVVLFVIVAGSLYVDPKNWLPYAPYGYGGVGFFGVEVWGQAGRVSGG